jgi:hypothetical protein
MGSFTVNDGHKSCKRIESIFVCYFRASSMRNTPSLATDD